MLPTSSTRSHGLKRPRLQPHRLHLQRTTGEKLKWNCLVKLKNAAGAVPLPAYRCLDQRCRPQHPHVIMLLAESLAQQSPCLIGLLILEVIPINSQLLPRHLCLPDPVQFSAVPLVCSRTRWRHRAGRSTRRRRRTARSRRTPRSNPRHLRAGREAAVSVLKTPQRFESCGHQFKNIEA